MKESTIPAARHHLEKLVRKRLLLLIKQILAQLPYRLPTLKRTAANPHLIKTVRVNAKRR